MPIEQLLNEKSVFEIVRDKIVEIISIEIANQVILADPVSPEYLEFLLSFYDLLPDQTLKLNLWSERFVRFDDTELNAINVYWDRSNLSKGSQAKDQKSSSKYVVDINVLRAGTEDNRGDELASKIMQRMLGVLRLIIMHTNYINLGFVEKTFISRRWVQDLQNYRPQENESKVNIDNIITGSLGINVEFDEKNLGVTPVDLGENITRITADENGEYRIDTENLNS